MIQAGIVLSNSEVGCGSYKVEPLLYRLICANGMIRGFSIRKYHVGRRVGGEGDDVIDVDFYEQETIEADTRALELKVRDTVRHAFSQIAFDEEIKLLQDTAEHKIEAGKIESTVNDVTGRFGFSKEEGEGILTRLIEGADLSQYGLANAITSMANDVERYDRVVELERIGGEIIDLSPTQWQTMAAA